MSEFFEKPPHGDMLREVLNHCGLAEYRRGDFLSEVGAENPAILIVSSGVLCIQTPDPFSGKDILYAPVFRGAAINMISGLRNVSTHTVRSLSHSNVYRLEQPAIRKLEPDQRFRSWCRTQMALNMESLFQYVVAVRTPSVDARILNILQAAYWETHRKMPDGTFSLPWPITQNDLAALAGISRPYLNASLKRLAKSGEVEFDGETVHVRLERAGG